MENINAENIHQTGVIISLSREIESVMTSLGATGAGLHDKTDFLSPKLSDECIRLLHYIAAVRNKNAHETTSMSKEDIELFVQSCNSVLMELRSIEKTDDMPENPPLHEDEILQKSASNEYDEIFFKQLIQTWKVLAWIPFVHIFYLAGGVLKELKEAAIFIILLLFYFAGIILFGTGLSDGNKFFWMSGIFIFLLVWIYCIVLRMLDKENKLHRNFCLIPFLNLVYLCYMIRHKTPLVHFFSYVLLLGFYIAGIAFFYREGGAIIAFILLGISYIGGIADSLTFFPSERK